LKKTATSILTDEEVAAVSEATLAWLRRDLGDHPLFTKARFEEIARFLPLARRCTEAREARGLSLKDVSQKLGVPQYRLRAVESAASRELLPDILERYVDLLGLRSWFAKWCRANRALVATLQLGDGRVRRSESAIPGQPPATRRGRVKRAASRPTKAHDATPRKLAK
jgi:hypothetical protein